MKLVTLSSKNQITIPKDALQRLSLLPQKKLLIEYKDKELILKPLTASIVEQTAGSLKSYVPKNKRGKSFKIIMEETKRKAAKYLAGNL